MSLITEKYVAHLLQQLQLKHEEQGHELEEDYQLMAQQAVAGAGNTITAALAPLTARQEHHKHTMDERINKINEDVSNISQLFSPLASAGESSTAQSSSCLHPGPNHSPTISVLVIHQKPSKHALQS